MPEPMSRCRSCQRPIWWRVNPSGKRQPMDYDLVANQPAQSPHHATCPLVQEWRKTRSTAVREMAETEPLPWWFR
jgi:hypothetical protein